MIGIVVERIIQEMKKEFPIITCLSFSTLTSWKFPVTLKLPTEKPASSTAFLIASISTDAFSLNAILNAEFLISDWTAAIKGSFCKAY